MNIQEKEILRAVLSPDEADDTQAIIETVKGLPRDFRLIFLGQAMMIKRGLDLPPEMPTPPAAAAKAAI